MAINLVIAVTDGDWFDMLRQQPNLTEVNFWAPSAAKFRALQPGETSGLHPPRSFAHFNPANYSCSSSTRRAM
jgi:putative restriction endonuclease